MAEKLLTEADWKKFAKGRDLKDAALLKAFAAYEKARSPDEQLKLLPAIEKELDALRKAGKGDKELLGQLDAMDKALERETRQVKAAEKEAQEHEAEEGEETPDLLTTKLIPLLRLVKKGEELPAMVASNGKKVAVLMSRRTISPTRRKLLADYLCDGGAPKYFLGTCLFEQNAYTFVLKTQATGLAKKVKAGLFEQVNLRLKVRVRGEAPDDIDDDGEEAPADELEAEEAGAAPDAAPTAPGAAPGDDPLKAEFEQAWAAVEAEALVLVQRGGPDAGKLRAVADFVREKGAAGAYKAALQGIQSLRKLIDAQPAGAAPEAASTAAPPAPAADAQAFNKRLAALLPAVKAATVDGGGQELKARVAEAGQKAAARDFAAAGALLDAAEALIAAARRGAPAPGAGGAEQEEAEADAEVGDAPIDEAARQRYEARLAEIEPGLLELFAARHPESSKLRSVLAYAGEQADSGEFAKAVAALERLAGLVEAARRAPGIDTGESYPGLVAYRKSLLALRAAVGTVERQIEALVAAIPGDLPDEADLAADLADELRESTTALHGLVDEAMSSAENQDTAATRALRAELDGFIEEVRGSPLIKHVDGNPFGVAVSVEQTLGSALENVRRALPALA